MFSIPTLVKRRAGEAVFTNGILIKLPMELCDRYRLRAYGALRELGWHKMEFGYSTYVCRTPDGTFYVFPGLQIEENPKPTKRFFGYNQFIARAQVERIAQATIFFEREMQMLAHEDVNLLVHDLRGLSSAIYNQALEASRFLVSGNTAEASIRVDNVIATQGILKMRTDALDFLSNPAALIQESDIFVYRKVDKVIRCFKSKAADQGKKISLHGLSLRSIRGPDIFELIPYTLLDNAVKYAPDNTDITVFVTEQEYARVTVRSLGPKIEDSEFDNIFERGFRSEGAIETKIPGNGIGLNVLRQVVDDQFGGSVEVTQSKHAHTYDEETFFLTDFIVSIPINGSR